MDLVGFGKSGRKPVQPYFDYKLWLRQAAALLARIAGERPGAPIGVIGHSLSGSLAAQEKAVAAVMTTGSMGGHFEANAATRRCWSGPRSREDLVLTLQGLIRDHSIIDEAYLAAREPVVFAPGYADYFDAMFKGDPARYIKAAALPAATLKKIACPVLMLHGREDAPFPPTSSVQIAERIAQADLVLLADCSHSVAFERSATFLALATEFFGRLK